MRLFKVTAIHLVLLAFFLHLPSSVTASTWWEVQSIDTMKYSRDMSREFLDNPQRLEMVADQMLSDIANTGATHVAIATPYDDEFLPLLNIWTSSARQHKLKVWFRGNWSGWEEWFEYAPIDRKQHYSMTEQFILANKNLFEDGDIFTACPECENGGPGDPRQNGDVIGHREFLLVEHDMMENAFKTIDKDVQINFNSMNGDVAELVMNPATTRALGGYTVVDHYVEDPAKLNTDSTRYAAKSMGKVVLGEFGAPIPDINGRMTETEQAAWLEDSLSLLVDNPNVIGLNYWTSMGGSTAIWNDDGSPRAAVAVLTKYFSPNNTVSGTIVDTLGRKIDQVEIKNGFRTYVASNGEFSFPFVSTEDKVKISLDGYVSQEVKISDLVRNSNVELVPVSSNLFYKIFVALKNIFT